jgi:microsomal dipeptidase-like Zn-dependent dipeptidase
MKNNIVKAPDKGVLPGVSLTICLALLNMLPTEAMGQTGPLQPGLVAPVGTGPFVLPPAEQGPVLGGACGLHQVNDPTFVPLTVTAQAASPFSILITVSGPPGSYAISSAALQDTLTVGKVMKLPAIAAGSPGGGRTSGNPAPLGTYRHMPVLPGTIYDYVVKADLGSGRTACGTAAAATSTPPPPTNLSGQYLDESHVSVGFMIPPFVHEAHVYRGSTANPSYKVADIGVAGRHFAGEQGQLVPAVVVDPGPPPFPYDKAGRYIRPQGAYPFLLEVIWAAYPDGSGPRVSATFPFAVPGPTPIVGYADLHSHQMSYFGFGGDPQHFPLGHYMFGKAHGPIDAALPWCTPVCGPGGVNDLAEYFLKIAMYGSLPPNTGHAVGGFPAFDGYPRWDSFTGQAYYESWLQRAHLGGLQLIVVHPVNNAWMSTTLNHLSTAILAATIAGGPVTWLQIAPVVAHFQFIRDPECLDDSQAMNQVNEIWAMQNDIDQRVGDGHGHFGPGTGWYRVVRSPKEARATIAAGKLAVVIGMEVDNPFDCTLGNPACKNGAWMNRFNSYFQLGVRHFFPIHFYNNTFGGSADSNQLIAKSFTNQFVKRDCGGEGYEYDSHQCNADGLYADGQLLIRTLMSHGMIIDVDHMSARAFDGTLDIVTPSRYPVVSSHAGFVTINHGDERNEGQRSDPQIARMLNVGGMFAVIPHQGKRGEVDDFPYGTNIRVLCGNSSQTVVQAYRYAVVKSGNGPIGIGTDLGGFAGWPSPRFGPDECMGDHPGDYDQHPGPALRYPYRINATGVSISSTMLDPGPSITTTGMAFPNIDAFGHSVIGQRVFDFNTDGFAHIGLLPDMIADWEAMGMSSTELDPLFFSAEGYIRVWERASYLGSHGAQ